MVRIEIAEEKCVKCGLCQETCPTGKIKVVRGRLVVYENVECVKCYACEIVCPADAIRVVDVE